MPEDIFAVVWIDRLLGLLTLRKPDARQALEAARHIRHHGAGKVRNVHAVRLPAESDDIEYLDPDEERR